MAIEKQQHDVVPVDSIDREAAQWLEHEVHDIKAYDRREALKKQESQSRDGEIAEMNGLEESLKKMG